MRQFWTMREYNMLRAAQSFADLVEVALVVLPRMHYERKTIIEIIGPISTGGLGNKPDNLRRFGHAIDLAKEKGLLVFDIVPFEAKIHDFSEEYLRENPNEDYCWAILEEFYGPVFESRWIEAALSLPDFKSSRGASWEDRKLQSLAIPVDPYPPDWIEEVNQRMCLAPNSV